MKILRHRLHDDDGTPVPFKNSPNQRSGLDAKYLIIHYTAGSSAESSIRALTDPARKVSAHLVIGRDGTITQLVPFDRVAWHAGESQWHNLIGLNRHSIGIELDNAGVMKRDGDAWRSWFERRYPAEEVIEAVHRNETQLRGWHRYTEPQLDAAANAARTIVARYGLRDVLGHEDISPRRKTDPGPAFPMESFRAGVMSRVQDELPEFVTTTVLNVREGPGTGFERLPESPLQKGVRLRMQARDGAWCFVEVLDANGTPTATGWVHGNFVEPV